jgi:hypothetical protein
MHRQTCAGCDIRGGAQEGFGGGESWSVSACCSLGRAGCTGACGGGLGRPWSLTAGAAGGPLKGHNDVSALGADPTSDVRQAASQSL